jgi:hypothetical protein
MEPFVIFLSHCAGDSTERDIVRQFDELLCEAFNHEKKEGHLTIEYDGRTLIHVGSEVRDGCVKKVKSSDLVICCFFPRYRKASYFEEEVTTALEKGKPIMEVRFIPRNNPRTYLDIGEFDRRLEEEQGDGRPRRVVIEIQYDHNGIDAARVREELRRHVAGGDLVDAIREQILKRAQYDPTLYSTADEVIDDFARHKTPSIRLFFYDGGSTIRKLQAHRGFQDLLDGQNSRLIVDYLYVDTACKTYVSGTPEYRASAALQTMDEGAYSALYEALCRSSGLVHNQSPHGHMTDVARSIKTLKALRDKYHFQLNIRKTCQLPIYRLMISREFVYYTHIFPHFASDPEQGSPNYYSLRLSRKSRAGKDLIDHYDSLWTAGAPEPSDA